MEGMGSAKRKIRRYSQVCFRASYAEWRDMNFFGTVQQGTIIAPAIGQR